MRTASAGARPAVAWQRWAIVPRRPAPAPLSMSRSAQCSHSPLRRLQPPRWRQRDSAYTCHPTWLHSSTTCIAPCVLTCSTAVCHSALLEPHALTQRRFDEASLARSAAVAAPCMHRFCQECVEKWVRVGRRDCPECSTSLVPVRKLKSTGHDASSFRICVRRTAHFVAPLVQARSACRRDDRMLHRPRLLRMHR